MNADGEVVIQIKADSKPFEKDIASFGSFLKQTEEKIGRQLTKQEVEQLEELYQTAVAKGKKISSALEESMDKGGKGLKSIIKNVTRWGLALFGIRSAYNMIRNSISTISQGDNQLKADLDYMRNALAYTLEPLVRKIIEWAKQLLFYIGYIIKIWTGKNIFENANKSLKNADKSAKSLQKTLAGFDEMNILNEDGSVGALGGVSPSFDLSALNMDTPKWLDWIAYNKDIVLGFLQALLVALVGLKNGWQGIMTLGIGVAILGVINLVKDVIAFIQDPSWENFRKILLDITNVIIGVGLALIGLEATNPAGWIALAIGVIGNFIIKLSEEKDATERLRESKEKLNQAEREFVNAQNTYVNAIANRDDALKKLQEAEQQSVRTGEELYNSIIFGTEKYDDLNEAEKKTYLAYTNYRGTIADLEEATNKLKDKEHEQLLATIDVQKETAVANKNFKDLDKTISELVKNGKLSTKEARDILKDAYKSTDKEGRKIFKEQLPSYINTSIAEVKELSNQISKAMREYDSLYNKSRGHYYVSPYAKGGIAYAKGGIVPTIKLASGAIINKPGRGVPIGGERGPEGVIPLTDSQQMSLLGEAIGRYISINATVPVYVGNRMVARELKRIEAEDDFAYNR